MTVPPPHFLLHAEAAPAECAVGTLNRRPAADILSRRASEFGGQWRFVLQLPNGETSLEAADEEPEATPERLELLAIVRGLEALSQPSRVTLLTGSKYLRRGLNYGLAQWRENDWQWERYGRMTPVKNGDLWQRLDRLLAIHALECAPATLDKADDLAPPIIPPKRASKGSGRVLRVDAGHTPAKHQISNHKHQTISKSKGRNDRKAVAARHEKFGHLNPLGYFASWAQWLQTRGKEH